MSACRPTTRMRKVLSGAISPPQRRCARTCVQGVSTRLSWSQAAYTTLSRRKRLAGRHADIVAFARQSLADPDWFQKVRLGRGDEVRLCAYTNYCEALDQRHRQVTCARWDRLQLDEPGVALSADRKRRLTAPSWDA